MGSPAGSRPTADDFEAVGLYDPCVDAGRGRLELLQWLHDHGLTLDEMVTAHRDRALGAVVGDRRLVPGERLDRATAVERSGLDGDRFDAIAGAFGFTRLQTSPPDEIGFTDAEVGAIAAFSALGDVFTDADSLAFLRVIGGAMNRIAEAGVSLFLHLVEDPTLQSGASELELAQQVFDAVGVVDGLAEQLDPVLRRQLMQAVERTRQAMIGEAERFWYRYTVGFVDLVGYTELSGSLSAPALAEFLRDFEGRAHDIVHGHGARVVKLIGDEVMFTAIDPAEAVAAGLALIAAFDDGSTAPRGGMACGDVLLSGGDYFGSVVNLAARLVDLAVPGELLVTDELAAAAPSCSFEPAGRRVVKGFADPVGVRSAGR
jgi:class 3 adenylate cyclase